MNIAEAAEIVRRRWEDNDGCRSCGWKSALYEFGPLEHRITQSDIDRGYIDLPCYSDDDGGGHRGIRVYFTDQEEV